MVRLPKVTISLLMKRYRSYLQSYKNALADVDKELPPWADSELDAGDNRDPQQSD